jgi:riboflavin biosynthesis pyrimidine reductase
MSFQPPKDLAPFEVLFDHSEANPALPPALVAFAGNMGFPPPPPQRPWVFANFVQSLDGLVSFGGTRLGGEWISGQSRHDRWMMDLLRAHADALLCGAGTLRSEALHGPIPGGPVYRIVDDDLLALRQERLQLPTLKIIIVSGSGALRPADYRLFQSERVETWIATTPEGQQRIGNAGSVRLLISGSGGRVDWVELLLKLRAELSVRYLLCEGGPTLYGDLARADLVDEKFLTVSPQEIGAGLSAGQSLEDREANAARPLRPTSLAGPGFSVETALWYRWISCRRAGDHGFNRYRRWPLTH